MSAEEREGGAGRLPVAGRGRMPAPMTRLQQVILGLLAAAVVAGTVAFGVLRLYTASEPARFAVPRERD
jgi:hypothetical protein